MAMTLGTAAFHNPAGPTAVIMENTRVRSYDDAYIYPFEEENTPDETPVGFYPRAVRRVCSCLRRFIPVAEAISYGVT